LFSFQKLSKGSIPARLGRISILSGSVGQPELPRCLDLGEPEHQLRPARICVVFKFRCRFGLSIRMRQSSKKIALLCLLLALWSVVAFVAHHHSSTNEALTCRVCVAAHSAAPVAAAVASSSAFFPIAAFRAEAVSAQHRLIAFALSVRPPPAV
jgi:hypothetical protein